MSNKGNTFLGLLAGTPIGVVLGILYAPDKGSVTRRRIADQAATTQIRCWKRATNYTIGRLIP